LEPEYQRGSVLVVLALSLPVLLLFLALVLDVGEFYDTRQRMQTAADAGALAGALEIYRGSTSLVVSAAQEAAAANGFTYGTAGVTVTVNQPPTNGGYAGNARYVEVIVSQGQRPHFWLGRSSVTVSARAVAGLRTRPTCIYQLDPATLPRALQLTSNSRLTASNCGIMVNSRDSGALYVANSSNVTAQEISIVGGYRLASGGTVSPTPQTGVPVQPDPLQSLQPPAVGGCNFTNITACTSGTRTYTPGVYCTNLANRGIRLSNNCRATFNPGTYVLRGGGMVVNNPRSVTGTGVNFYNTGDNTYPEGPIAISVNPNRPVVLSARTTGALAHVLFFQDRNLNPATNMMTLSSSVSLTGILYFPTQALQITGSNPQPITGAILAQSLSESSSQVTVTLPQPLPGNYPLNLLQRPSLVE
jgi:hypothetical protein